MQQHVKVKHSTGVNLKLRYKSYCLLHPTTTIPFCLSHCNNFITRATLTSSILVRFGFRSLQTLVLLVTCMRVKISSVKTRYLSDLN